VALEYQRNRLKVIAGQNSKFSEVRKVINKGTSSIKGELDSLNLEKRHSTIEPENFVNELESAEKKFLDELDKLEKEHFSVISEDRIRSKLDNLLEGKVGLMPADQSEIIDLEKEAAERFKNKVPPGYMDEDKDNSDEPTFSYGNLVYQRKYSDYLVWSQLLTFAKNKKISDLIFVTDDNKEDWWLKVKQNGVKTISPRPELIGEVFQTTSVERFHMYSSEGFLKYANKVLQTEVSSEAIEEVRDVARTRTYELNRIMLMRNIGRSTENAVFEWLSKQYGKENLVHPRNSPIDLMANANGRKIGFDIKAIRQPRNAINRLRHTVYEAHYFAEKNDVDELVLVLVTFESELVEGIQRIVERSLRNLPPITIMIGVAELDEDSGEVSDFVPYNELRVDNS
jgi:hypothetical protein